MAEKLSYQRAKDHIKRKELPTLPLSIRLKDGSEISNVTPYAIVEGYMDKKNDREKTLRLFYLDENKKARKVAVDKVKGLRVVEGKGDYKGKLMIEFTYFKGTQDADFSESNPRVIFATNMNYGIHSFHESIGEKRRDFYIVGEDQQYAESRSRQFPLWRVEGVYDDNPGELVEEFKTEKL